MTNIKRVRQITKEELDGFILPAREILKDIGKRADFAQVTGSERQAIAEKSSPDSSEF